MDVELIQRPHHTPHLTPRLLSSTSPMTRRAFLTWRCAHITHRVLDPGVLSYKWCYDVASVTYLALRTAGFRGWPRAPSSKRCSSGWACG